jgi:hypothetical protein
MYKVNISTTYKDVVPSMDSSEQRPCRIHNALLYYTRDTCRVEMSSCVPGAD